MTARPRTALVLAVAVALMLLGTPSVAVGGVDATPTRIGGADRFETAALLTPPARDVRPETVTAIVARGDAFPDALAAAGLAGAHAIGVLLTAPPTLPHATAAALADSDVDEVLVLGGRAAVSDQVVADLRGQGYAVRRVAGADRYGTAAAAARDLAAAAGVGVRAGRRTALLVSGEAFPDALAAGPAAASGGHPILLTTRDRLPPATSEALTELAIEHVVVLGGHAAVSEAVAADLRARGLTVQRIAGPDRTVTAARVADALVDWGFDGSRVLLARGDGFADALAAGPFGGSVGAPILLTPAPDRLGEAARAWLADRCGRVPVLQAVGGAAALQPAALDEAFRAVRLCADVRGTVRFGVDTEVDPATGADPGVFRSTVIDPLRDHRSWGAGGVLAFDPVEQTPHLRFVLAPTERITAASTACVPGLHCRVGDILYVDAGRWQQPPVSYEGRVADYRRYVVNHLAGRWLGLEEAGCPGGGQPAPVLMVQTRDPGGCAANPVPLEVERRAAERRYVPTVTVALTGDVHGEGVVRQRLLAGANPLEPVAPILGAADLAVVNLETAVGSRGRPDAKTFTFQAPPQLLTALSAAGVDAVSLANNHALDYGVEALFETLDLAQQAGLRTVGAGRNAAEAYAPALFDVAGRRVALVGLTRVLHTQAWAATATRPGLASAYDEAAAVAAVRHAAGLADHVVVMVHWGIELAECPDGNQLRLARLLRDAGADVVAGHHPHILQGIDTRDGGLVAYSLGNFVWYHSRVPSRFTGVLTAELRGASVGHSFAPAEIAADGSPVPVAGAAAASILADVARRSPGGGACRF